jgi:hypothetical protein
MSSVRLKPSRAKRTQMVLGLILNEVQVSPKGKKRNEVSFFGNLVTLVRKDHVFL